MRLLSRLLPLLLLLPLLAQVAPPDAHDRPRARDLGLQPGIFPPGAQNAITDVEGVRVGHRTLIRGDAVRIGVTAVLPHGGNLFQEKVPAAVWVGNGFGKAAHHRWYAGRRAARPLFVQRQLAPEGDRGDRPPGSSGRAPADRKAAHIARRKASIRAGLKGSGGKNLVDCARLDS